ncbi:MAG TPA: tetratricopeptide repeat protein, partial [Bacteroidia bacterium]|nr:tetratricopeptide repeat protein [Bacteroidia bacterium]
RLLSDVMRKFFPVLFLLFLCEFSFAQKTTIYTDADREYKTGTELFDKKKYGAALKSFQNIIETNKNPKSLIRIDAEFYAAACAIELVNKDGEWRMKKFIDLNPESNKVKWGYFYLGKSNFRKKKYPETIEYLEKVDVLDLDKDDACEFRFKRGYSYLEAKQIEKAKIDLYEIKDIDNKYAHPANYYYSHIAYTEKNYSTALEGFTRLLNNETFGTVVPYYIAQIYFLQGKYDEVIKVAPALLNDSTHAQKAGEINRIIGQSYFHKQKYAEAIPYLLKGPIASVNDNYQMGYAYYKTSDLPTAASYFEKAVGADDSLSQNAYYYLADCYLKGGDKSKARNAYFSAYSLSYDKQIREESLFNYAKLCYETGFSPYNDAIKYFQQYITEYPKSINRDEAFKYLVNCFHSTKNYEGAMRIIEKMNTDEPGLKQVYQQLCYFRAVNHYNNNQADSARKYFNFVFRLNVDPVLTAQSKYWLGELSYQGKAYNNAADTWGEFQKMPGSFNLKEYDLANYNIGYAFFMNKNYADAGVSFRKYLMSKNLTDPLKAADANVRTADCYFMQKTFSSAADYYETAIALNKIDVDYAIYQKALCNGMLKNYKEKISDLQQLQKQYPSSPYIVQSVFEIAESFKMANEPDNAILWYDKIINNYPTSPYVTRATKTAGFLFYNQNKYDKAFSYLDKIVKQNPKSDEAKDAIETIKKIFKEQNKPDEMETYMNSIGSSVSVSELDESYWEKASALYYDKKDCDAATPEMQKYINKFPDGKYITDANFCFAECSYNKGDFTVALTSYKYILSKSRNIHTEIALAKASYILYKDKKYDEALLLYMQLQGAAESSQNKLAAKLGAMRCSYQVKSYDTCVNECNKVLNTEKLSSTQLIEAHQLKARSLYELNRRDEAIADLNYLTKNAKSEAGAEAYYYLAMIHFQKKELKETEKTVNSLIGYNYTNNDWNTKGMLLMADVYTEKKDYTNAEAVLQSIIENANKPEYIDLAKQKLQEIRDKQTARMQEQKPSGDMQIQFQNKGNDVLLEQPKIKRDTLKTNTVQPK